MIFVGCTLVGEPRYLRAAPEAGTVMGMDVGLDAPTMDDRVEPVDRPSGLDAPADVMDVVEAPADVPTIIRDVPNPPNDVPNPCPQGGSRCGIACVNLQDDTDNCGACGNRCPMFANAATSCRAGQCQPRCDLGFDDCNGNRDDGCETRLNDSRNCGRCGVTCQNPAPTCAGPIGFETCQLSCVAGQTLCGGRCVSVESDPGNCGGCGVACGAGPNQSPICNARLCATRCDPGYANCNLNPADGCEVQLARDARNCGSCGTICPAGSNQVAACIGGVCGVNCQPGFADCNLRPFDGCESELALDPQNCGACGQECLVGPNVSACVAGRCGSCPPMSTFCPHGTGNPREGPSCCAGLAINCALPLGLCFPARAN